MKNKNLLLTVIILLVCALWGGVGSLQASDYYDGSFDGAKRRRVNSTTSEQEDNLQDYFPLLELLSELLTHVFSFVEPKDLVSLRGVNQALKTFTSLDIFEYQLKLCYGIFTSSIMFPKRFASLSFSKDGKNWEHQKMILMNGDFVSSVEKCRLTKYNKHQYAAIFSRNEDQSGVQILSCEKGARWNVVTSKEGVTLNDLQWVSFREQLWLAYTSSDTFTLNFADADNLRMGFQTNLQNIKSFSLTEFKDRIYMAYTTMTPGTSEIYVASSEDGITWDSYQTPCYTFKNVQLISYQNKLRLMYAHTNKRQIDICSSQDGKSWSLDCSYTTLNNPENLESQISCKNLTLIYACLGVPLSRSIIKSRDGEKWGESHIFSVSRSVSSPLRPLLVKTK